MKKVTLFLAGLLLALPVLAQQGNAAATGGAIAGALNKRDIEGMMQMIDAEAVSRLVIKDLGLSARDRELVVKGLPRALRNNVEIGVRSIEGNKGAARYLRAGARGERSFALVRLDLGDQGTEYVEYLLTPAGKVEDWYAHSMATLFCTSAALGLATVLKTDSILFGVFGSRLATDADVKPFTTLRTQLQAQDFAGAYRTLESFPENFRKTRQWALMRVTYGGRINEATHRAALRYLAQQFGGDADLQFMLIDHYVFESQLDRALTSVAALERAVGGEDAATANLRGSILISAKRYDEAAKACRRGMTLEADYAAAYWCLVTVGISTRNGKIAVEGLQAYEKSFGTRFDLAKLGALEQYREIAKTPEFTAWAKSRR
jgi:hypothetical protein